MQYQRTLKHDVHFSGVGLHFGEPANLTVKPAPPNTGIVFSRTDSVDYEPTRAVLANVTAATLSTTLGFNGSSVNTVEHILSALAGMGIDNAHVEVDSSEVPILDGSAEPFVRKLKDARFTYDEEAKKVVVIKEPISVRCEDKYIEAFPADRLIIDYTIDFSHPLLQDQSMTFTFSYSKFEEEICSARTFCFLHEVEMMRANGYARGGSLENAVVIDKNGILNEEGLRFPDEFVRHKVLDLVGDLSLLGHPIIGYIKAYKSGHALNHQFLKEVLNQYQKWDLAKIVGSEDTYAFQKAYQSPFIPRAIQ
jgi:UDP-3-O-[3-hydroxymyristoyl] N-acetylglucosamine deacetylase